MSKGCESLFQVSESINPMASEPSNTPNLMATTDDQRFLLTFILGTYFGPDLKEEKPQKSALQRIAEGVTPYSSDQLSGSQMKTVEVERVYYYVLRKADQSVIVKLPLLHQFFQGGLFPPFNSTDGHHQFPDLFPSHFHQHGRFRNRYEIIENIVFINNPEISYIRPDNVERFKRLTGLENLLLDRDSARLFGGAGIGGIADDVMVPESNGKQPLRRSLREFRKRRRPSDYLELGINQSLPVVCDVPHRSRPHHSTSTINTRYRNLAPLATKMRVGPGDKVGPAMLFLPSHPTVDEWNNVVEAAKSGIAFTGSVAERQAGPLIGLVDIGVCEDAYLFRMSLPGVKKDEREFRCEVETDGRVLIEGVTTTGDRLVFKKSQVFEMQTQYLCRSGHFSISFQLPGPVEPQEFSGNFGSDGILEGIVMKESGTQ